VGAAKAGVAVDQDLGALVCLAAVTVIIGIHPRTQWRHKRRLFGCNNYANKRDAHGAPQ
jgi:hypothetical protein